MHDPMSQALDLCRRPWHWPRALFTHLGCPYRPYHESLVTVWHVDPEREGNDDSCHIDDRKRHPEVVGFGWRWRFHLVHFAWLRLSVVAVVGGGGFRLSFFGSSQKRRPDFSAQVRRSAPGWGTPGMLLSAAIPYPIVGWSITVHPLRSLRRWLLTRCERCGKRFRWNYAPISPSWDSPKPKFLRGSKGLYHHECDAEQSKEFYAAREAAGKQLVP